MEVNPSLPCRVGGRTNGQCPQIDSKKPSFLSRLKSTLDKDIWTKPPQKKRPIQPPAGRLPQELAEYIIDNLWYHFESLLACCLTCRAWVEPSRYHLFYRRRLIYEHQYKSLSSLRRHGLIGYIRRIEMDLLPPVQYQIPYVSVPQGCRLNDVLALSRSHGISHLPFPGVYETRASHLFTRHPRTHQSRRSFERYSPVHLFVPEPG